MNTNTPITDKMIDAFLDTFNASNESAYGVVKRWEAFRSQHSSSGRDWEIISVWQGRGSYIEIDKNGKVRYAHFSDCTIEDALNNRGYSIYGVRRLSDGEVFSIGDDILHREEENEGFGLNRRADIISFSIRGNDLLVGFMPKGETSKSGDVWRELINVKKTPEEKSIPLFTTFDGKEIFGDQNYWKVDENFNIRGYAATEGGKYPASFSKLTFSTEQGANEYTLMKKPCLSMKDIIEAIDYANDSHLFLAGKLKDIAQAKINPLSNK